MRIDINAVSIKTESDAEQKFVMPLLSRDEYLAIPILSIKTKEYLRPSNFGKKAGISYGDFPDYSIWMHGFPVLLVEAKSPKIDAAVGYREAQLYAQSLNNEYPSGINPTRFLIATNAVDLLFGYSDAEPIFRAKVSDLKPGTQDLVRLQSLCGRDVLQSFATHCADITRKKTVQFPYHYAGGAVVLRTQMPYNKFASQLSPLLAKYFSPSQQENTREIVTKAYVSTDEVTEYDRILESLLKERIATRRGAIVEHLNPERHGEDHIEKAIAAFAEAKPESGQLQIIQGAVGSGKSLFVERYKEVLQPDDARKRTRWATIDFNSGPVTLAGAEEWLCDAFNESFVRDNPEIELSEPSVARGVYSRNLQRRKPVYTEYEKISQERATVARAEDIAKWQDDPVETAKGIADYVRGNRSESLVVVMDNVDRLDLDSQLAAFQLTLWFMHQTRAFVILQMRDETYERFRNQPPLDTFRTGVVFHISPPRFVDVVKRRLDLILEALSSENRRSGFFEVESGLRVKYDADERVQFLRRLYEALFDRRNNISRVLEALAGKDVRKALEMFVSIIISGHLSETTIASHTIGGGNAPLREYTILKILMRTHYRLASKNTGFVTNLFAFNEKCKNADNFIAIEILFYLARRRKSVGGIGLEGYFTYLQIVDALQVFGYDPEDLLYVLGDLNRADLISNDRMSSGGVELDDAVRITASGYIHVRVLTGRFEYLYGVIPETPIFDQSVATKLASFIKMEVDRGDIDILQKVRAVDEFHRYLWLEQQSAKTPFKGDGGSGADYVLEHMKSALAHARNAKAGLSEEDDPLDV
jgi:hypothetical protein